MYQGVRYSESPLYTVAIDMYIANNNMLIHYIVYAYGNAIAIIIIVLFYNM